MAGTVNGSGNDGINELNHNINKLNRTMNKQSPSSLQKKRAENIKLANDQAEILRKNNEEMAKATGKIVGTKMEEAGKKVGESLGKTFSSVTNLIGGTINDGIKKYFGAYDNYMSEITTRLLGTGKDYNSVFDSLQQTLGGQSNVSLLRVLQSVEKLVQTGITANLEQRAYLDSVTDRIATTFDATNATLLQISRLNRTDSTAAYLGIEASLTEFFNSQFADTNYLTSSLNDAVSSAIYEATSQLGTRMGAEFEFQVQKWLGSFYEAGVNNSTIQNLATAIGYLGSGNVNALTGNSALNNMMAMASTYAGLDYGNLLTRGITASDVNALMQGIYSQGVVMAQSGDKVAQSQYGALFGMNMSDLRALSSISNGEIESIANIVMGYGDLLNKTDYELTQVSARTSFKKKIDNVLENVMASVAGGITNDIGSYATYLIADLIGDVNIPVPIPMVGVMDVNVTQGIKTGIVGLNLLTHLGEVFNALSGNDIIKLSSFNSTYGGGAGFISGADTDGALTEGTGVVTYIASGDKKTLLNSSLAKDEEATSVVSSQYETETDSTTIGDLQDTILDCDTKILVMLESIDRRLENFENGTSVITTQKTDSELLNG